ncbi:(2Fe-2S)-binding protein [Hymenobacter terricola]|uniref:(2Fe-2S)-binding protein n=1 Tax=Hymenobacter terricola TaxID=2819236 RepID=UPI001B3163C3|nr:2Fe-2S iron-sulfur cluster-binding protein [Hymenobacter terricola]
MSPVTQVPAERPPVALAPTQPITLHINGQDHFLTIAPWTTLLDALREYLALTGTKQGCDHGQCGACTVLVDGKRINSCLSLAVMQEGADIQTIEGLGTEENLHPLQQAFIDHDAFQCGYCTPGQICSAQGLINEGKAKTEDEVRELMSGNICRCGAYSNILTAIMEVLGNKEDGAEVSNAPMPKQEWSAGAARAEMGPVEPAK